MCNDSYQTAYLVIDYYRIQTINLRSEIHNMYGISIIYTVLRILPPDY